MADAYGQTDSLALAIASRINTMSATFCIEVDAERRFRLLDRLTDIPAYDDPPSVDVFPGSETSERQGISTAFASTYTVHLYIQQQVQGAEDEEVQCALLTRLRSEILQDLRTRRFNLTDAVHPVNDVFLVQIHNAEENGPAKLVYNLARLMNDHVFESDTILVFRASA